jgi:drug/metabolite transporter (DMT)-like permease
MSLYTKKDDTPLERDIAIHIFSASAAMVGVCLTVISIVQTFARSREVQTLVDDVLAIKALVFLCACLLSYWALRTRSIRRMHRVESAADMVFLTGLCGTVCACGMIVWAATV